MSLYLLVKYLHMTTAALSISGFMLRALWMVQDSARLHARPSKILPHVNDALLLGSALAMVFMSGQYPFVLSWLTAKVLGLLVYIVLGMVALKWGKSRTVRIGAGVLAVLTFVYIVSVAISRSPLGLLSYF